MTYAHEMPWRPGNTGGVTTPATHEQLNASAYWKRWSREDLAAVDVTDASFLIAANDSPLIVAVSGFGNYRYAPLSELPHDNELVIAPDTGGGRWILEHPSIDSGFAYYGG